MAKKKKSTSAAAAATRKALAGIQKAQKALQLHIKKLRASMGHVHGPSRMKGTPTRRHVGSGGIRTRLARKRRATTHQALA